jgi:hypothetical protein
MSIYPEYNAWRHRFYYRELSADIIFTAYSLHRGTELYVGRSETVLFSSI